MKDESIVEHRLYFIKDEFFDKIADPAMLLVSDDAKTAWVTGMVRPVNRKSSFSFSCYDLFTGRSNCSLPRLHPETRRPAAR
ncbi:MAG TPA: hypothetical protein VFB98_08140 [Candidatus Deferrimicrobium sp.]|nr:hypothetical protein [Candidatus Deferrimicrobium sp.]